MQTCTATQGKEQEGKPVSLFFSFLHISTLHFAEEYSPLLSSLRLSQVFQELESPLCNINYFQGSRVNLEKEDVGPNLIHLT